jgi:hypothetical protein
MRRHVNVLATKAVANLAARALLEMGMKMEGKLNSTEAETCLGLTPGFDWGSKSSARAGM